MRPILGMLIMFLIINVFILGLGIGTGYLLTWIIPVLNLSVAMLMGVVSVSVSLFLFIRFLLFTGDELLSSSTLKMDEETLDTIEQMQAPASPRRKSRRKKWEIE
jgi:hypothetical protein